MKDAENQKMETPATNGAIGPSGPGPCPTGPPDPETVPITDQDFVALIAECRQAGQTIEAQARGALILYLRQKGMTGNWQISENGRELVRM